MTAPTLTLETDDERDLWTRVLLQAMLIPGDTPYRVRPAHEQADAAVRAYRERCAPAGDALEPGALADAIDMCDKMVALAEGLHSPRQLGRLERDAYMRADAARHIRAVLQRCAPVDPVADAAARREGVPVAMYERLAATTHSGPARVAVDAKMPRPASKVERPDRGVAFGPDERRHWEIGERALREENAGLQARLDALTRAVEDELGPFTDGACAVDVKRLRAALDAAKGEEPEPVPFNRNMCGLCSRPLGDDGRCSVCGPVLEGDRFTGKACEPRCDEDGQVRLRDFTYPCPEHGSAS